MRNRKDHYFRKAKKEGYVARSIYKLIEINKKYNLVERNSRVLDIGSSPGSWVQACIKIHAKEIVGVDIEDTKVQSTNFTFIKEDITKLDIDSLGKFDVVLSDIAPSTSGNIDLDVDKSIELSEMSFEIAKKVLKEDGNFLVKVFQGDGFEELLKKIKKHFKFCKSYKPQSTRKQSKEIYIVATNYIKEKD
jgi:23S rRNA (uridine2552-2'-O)-methyltransferase